MSPSKASRRLVLQVTLLEFFEGLASCFLPGARDSIAKAKTRKRRRMPCRSPLTEALHSTHTITLYDFGMTDEGYFYYVMELLRGVDLESMVQRFGPTPPNRTIYLLKQVCHSLGDAHRHGLIHRDIKPANIYASRLGPDYDFVKVLDFGLVKSHQPAAEEATQLTMQGVTTGTPAYMAPEMALDRETVDGRTDLYALGCVGYWLLTGQLVFPGKNPMQVLLHHVKTEPTPPSQRSESYCQKLWMEHQAAISSSRTPLMNFTFSMTSPRRR